MSSSDETSGSTGGEAPAPGSSEPAPTGSSEAAGSGGPMLAIAVLLGVVTLALIGLAIWSFSIDHTKRGAAALIVAVLAAGGGAYVLVKSRQS